MASWTDHVVWWHVYPLGFTGAPQTRDDLAGPDGGSPAHPDAPPAHRIDRLRAWLPYLVDLGANGLLLGPVFDSETHGYDTRDHLTLDPRLGDDADLDALLADASARGVRVLLDGVFNHVGRSHPRFAQALADGPGSEAASWFRWDGAGEPVGFEGHGALVTLDHDSEAVRAHVAEVMIHWLDRGISGWRLDAAYAVPATFWAAVLPRVRERHPDAWFVDEMIHGDYAGYAAESTIDSITAYELWKSVRNSIAEGNLFELDWTLTRHAELLPSFTPQTFVGNHDVTRIASAVDPRHLGHAIALLLLLPGIPSIYAGDERGLTGVKEDRAGGDDAVRPEYPASPDDLRDDEHAARIRSLHQELVGLRRRHAWLVDARMETSGLTNTALTITLRPSGTGAAGGVAPGSPGALRLVLNIGDEPVEVAGSPDGREAGDVAGDGRVPGHSWAVLASA
ncbi:alpha-amylase family protein [Clavibacter michiganensis]|uniref:alpha-amylase family protein n=1 Tax=Clavibacter michiganensis TaxID=28447 RepID=UPI003DA1734D